MRKESILVKQSLALGKVGSVQNTLGNCWLHTKGLVPGNHFKQVSVEHSPSHLGVLPSDHNQFVAFIHSLCTQLDARLGNLYYCWRRKFCFECTERWGYFYWGTIINLTQRAITSVSSTTQLEYFWQDEDQAALSTGSSGYMNSTLFRLLTTIWYRLEAGDQPRLQRTVRLPDLHPSQELLLQGHLPDRQGAGCRGSNALPTDHHLPGSGISQQLRGLHSHGPDVIFKCHNVQNRHGFQGYIIDDNSCLMRYPGLLQHHWERHNERD